MHEAPKDGIERQLNAEEKKYRDKRYDDELLKIVVSITMSNDQGYINLISRALFIKMP